MVVFIEMVIISVMDVTNVEKNISRLLTLGIDHMIKLSFLFSFFVTNLIKKRPF